MSALGTKLARNANSEIELSAYIFGPTMMAWFEGDITLVQARNFLNNHLASNGHGPLSVPQEADAQTMQVLYTAMTDFQKQVYLHKLTNYTQLLQQREITVAQWDALMGLSA